MTKEAIKAPFKADHARSLLRSDNLNYNSTPEVESNDSLRNALNLFNTKELKNALFVESEFNHRAAPELDKHFIDGFITGYKFLKEIRQYGLFHPNLE